MTFQSHKLTNAFVRGRPHPAKGQEIVRDTELPGFFVVIGTRAKTYTVQADAPRTLGERRSVRLVIGRADQMDAAEARRIAYEKLGEIRRGKRKDPETLTLREAWGRYRTEHLERKGRSPRTVEYYRDSIERRLAAWLDQPLASLSEEADAVAARFNEISRLSGKVAANAAMRSLRAVYRHARKQNRALPPDHPATAISFHPEHRRDTAMDPEQLKAWHKQRQALPNAIRREFHLFLLLSGSRPDALSRAKWEHLNLERRALHFPDPKGGTARAFDMPLSDSMLACFDRVREAGRLLGSDAIRVRGHVRRARPDTYIFPALTRSGHLEEHREDRSDLSHWGGDLRQTFRTMAVSAGVSDLDCKLLMNHARREVSEGYITRGALWVHLLEAQEKMSLTLQRG